MTPSTVTNLLTAIAGKRVALALVRTIAFVHPDFGLAQHVIKRFVSMIANRADVMSLDSAHATLDGCKAAIRLVAMLAPLASEDLLSAVKGAPVAAHMALVAMDYWAVVPASAMIITLEVDVNRVI